MSAFTNWQSRIVITPAEKARLAERRARQARMLGAAQDSIVQGPIEANIMLGLLAAYGAPCTAVALSHALEIESSVIRYRFDKLHKRLLQRNHAVQIAVVKNTWFIEAAFPDRLDEMFELCLRILARDRGTLIANDISGTMLISRRSSATPSHMLECGQ